jgi:mobilome CxxCx(11)CxxC protein
MAVENFYNKLRNQCWENYENCLAVRYIFEKREYRLKYKIRLLRVFGFVTPAFIGMIVITYGKAFIYLDKILWIAGVFSIIQFIISLLAIFYGWDDELSYCYEAIPSYNYLSEKYHDLANFPPSPDFIEYKNAVNLIDKENSERNRQNTSHTIKDWEDRIGMRYSLRERQKYCPACDKIPFSMKSTDCDVCGKFTFKYRTFIHKIIK